jgi:glycosyltransferase involved in cell wall biosynthesis
LSTSIIVPCRNEAGSIDSLLSSILSILGTEDELIIVEGGSYDATWEVVKKFASLNGKAFVETQHT